MTATLSVEPVQVRFTWVADAAVAPSPPGTVGACVSVAAGVLTVAVFE